MIAKILIFIAGIIVGELLTFGMMALCKSASDADERLSNSNLDNEEN